MSDHSGVIDIARNGVDEVIRLNRVVADLRALLREVRDCVCEELNYAEVIGARKEHIDYHRDLLARIDAALEVPPATPADPQSPQPPGCSTSSNS